MKLVHAERNGEAFDSQLVIGVRESYGRQITLALLKCFYLFFNTICLFCS
jgi:hypothetical protein